MNPPTVVNPIAVALEKALEASLLKGEQFDFEIESHKLRIHLKGKNWSNVVDRPVANFILDLDKRIREELKKQGVQIPVDDHGFVVLRIEKGSLDSYVELAPKIIEAFGSWPTDSKMIAAVTMLVALGIFKGTDCFKSLLTAKGQDRLVDERQGFVKILADVVANRGALQAPVRKLIGSMNPADVIELPGEPIAVKKEVAVKRLAAPTTSRSKAKTFYVDEVYVVESLNTKPSKWEIGLRYGNVSFKAKLKLTDAEVSTLLEGYEAAHKLGSEIAPHLQVTAEFTAKGVPLKAEVIGVGKPRPLNKGLAAAIKEVKGD